MLAMRSSSSSPPRRRRNFNSCSRTSPRPSKRKAPDSDFPSSMGDYGDDGHRALTRDLDAVEDLRRELEEERNASSVAAAEATTMIHRLQCEKAEVQMEARQFRKFADEKIAHDLHMISSLEEECLRRGHAIDAIFQHLHTYRNQLLALGIDPDSSPPDLPDAVKVSEMENDDEVTDKAVVLKNSPRHHRQASAESVGSFLFPEIRSPRLETPIDDHSSDRICTVDSIGDERKARVEEEEEEGEDIRKLCARLQALEEDRESLKKEIASMRTEKAEMILLKEIANNISKGIGGGAAAEHSPEKGVRKENPSFGLFSLISALKARLAPAVAVSIFLCWKAMSSRRGKINPRSHSSIKNGLQ